MSVTVIDFETGDTLEIRSPDEVPEFDFRRFWWIAIWRKDPEGESERKLLGEMHVLRISRFRNFLFDILYTAGVSPDAIDKHRSEIKRVVEELMSQDSERSPSSARRSIEGQGEGSESRGGERFG